MVKKILFWDLDLPETRPLSRVRSIFSQRDGIFNSIERTGILYPDAEIHFYHPDLEYTRLIARSENFIPVDNMNEAKDQADIIIDSQNLSPFSLLADINTRLESDLNLMDKTRFSNSGQCVVGEKHKLFIHESAHILPQVVFDTREGVIVIDEGAEISPFSYLAGPLYVGKHARIDNARITGGCIVGKMVRLGGEIENSLINDFSNKHHEGFLGHSVLGSWVNLGALTTTSDLKNNYGEVSVLVPGLPEHDNQTERVSTGTIKFGSIIGDCSKTAIGTMMNTGTIIDFGCNLFGGNPGKYSPPLSWGIAGEKYETTRFISDCKTIFARRQQTASPVFEDLVAALNGKK